MSDTILPGAITASFGFFTRHEAVTVEAAMSRIFPDDDLGPGSVAAGAVYYLDRVLMGAEQHRQQFYRAAIRALMRLPDRVLEISSRNAVPPNKTN